MTTLLVTLTRPTLGVTVCSDAQDSWFMGWHTDFDYSFDSMKVNPSTNVIALGGTKRGSTSTALVSILSFSTSSDSVPLTELYSYEVQRSHFTGLTLQTSGQINGVHDLQFSEVEPDQLFVIFQWDSTTVDAIFFARIDYNTGAITA